MAGDILLDARRLLAFMGICLPIAMKSGTIHNALILIVIHDDATGACPFSNTFLLHSYYI